MLSYLKSDVSNQYVLPCVTMVSKGYLKTNSKVAKFRELPSVEIPK